MCLQSFSFLSSIQCSLSHSVYVVAFGLALVRRSRVLSCALTPLSLYSAFAAPLPPHPPVLGSLHTHIRTRCRREPTADGPTPTKPRPNLNHATLVAALTTSPLSPPPPSPAPLSCRCPAPVAPSARVACGSSVCAAASRARSDGSALAPATLAPLCLVCCLEASYCTV